MDFSDEPEDDADSKEKPRGFGSLCRLSQHTCLFPKCKLSVAPNDGVKFMKIADLERERDKVLKQVFGHPKFKSSLQKKAVNCILLSEFPVSFFPVLFYYLYYRKI